MLRRDSAEIMLQCSDETRANSATREPDPDFRWSVYLRVAAGAVLEIAAATAKRVPLLRGPERMFYGLVEFEVRDPDGHRICVSGEMPSDAHVRMHEERENR
jgi:hypothetical protein